MHRSSGFTLMELMVALVILGLLAGLVGPQFFGKIDDSKVKTVGLQVNMLKVAMQTYRLDLGEYPASLEDLWRSPESAGDLWVGPYLSDRVPLDPWDREYQYRVDSQAEQGFYLYSQGADGANGGEGLNADIGYYPSTES